MQEFNKYRVITAGFILMFIFVIAAIYANTRDAVATKMQEPTNISKNGNQINKLNPENQIQSQQNINSDFNNQILQINNRINQLEQKVYTTSNDDSQSVRCTVRGIISDGHIVPLSPEESINESRMNNREVLVTCVFK